MNQRAQPTGALPISSKPSSNFVNICRMLLVFSNILLSTSLAPAISVERRRFVSCIAPFYDPVHDAVLVVEVGALVVRTHFPSLEDLRGARDIT